MLYIGFAVILLFFSRFGAKRQARFLFNMFFFLFVALLCIRYGQGTDYFNYKRIYNATSLDYNSFWIKCFLLNVEPFYYLINVFAKKNTLSFSFVIIASSVIMGYFCYKTIRTYSKSYFLSFFIFYVNYFSYYYSALRQVIAMCITTYAIYCFLDKRNLIKFMVMCFLAMMFHLSAVICLFVPLILKIGKILRIDRLSYYIPFTFVLIISGVFFSRLLNFAAGLILKKYAAYQTTGFSLFALFPVSVRFLCAVLALHTKSKYGANFSRIESEALVLYLLGSSFFFVLFTSTVVSRLTDYFTVLEVIYFANAFPIKSIRKKSLTLCLTVFLFLTLFIKDLNAAQHQGGYYSKNPLNYPYITIFNKKAILDYRGDTKRMSDSLLFD